MQGLNWDDLRYVLAVADTGSVSGAARRLGVNHATVLRRIASFEDGVGTELFDKTRRGYAVAPDRVRIIDAAREVEAAVAAVGRLIAGMQTPLSGRIRVTSTDSLSMLILPGLVRRIRETAPGLEVEILASNHRSDMARIQAEVAVRPAKELPDDLTGEVVGHLGFAPYSVGAGEALPWLALTGVLAGSVAGVWLERARQGGAVQVSAAGADSFLVLAGMAASGEGVALLPCIVGEADPRLCRLTGIAPDLSVPIWVASHADMAGVPRIARFRAALVEGLTAMGDRLAGRVA